MCAERVEFEFHTTARPTVGKRHFLAAQRKHLSKSREPRVFRNRPPIFPRHTQLWFPGPPRPHLKFWGERMLVDDGTCPEGTIKRIIGGNGVLVPRKRACIPR
jgi:hypothetical protein